MKNITILGSILLVTCIFLSIITDIQTSLLYFALFTIGILITGSFNKREYRKYSINLYSILFIAGTIFIIACKIYMDYHNYDYLLVWDSISVFLPSTKNSVGMGDLRITLYTEWYGWGLFEKTTGSSDPGYYTLLFLFGYLSDAINSDLFITLQLSTLFFSSFIGVALFRMICINGISMNKSYYYSLIISLFSIIFFYSTLILRDSHITLFYLLAIYLTFKQKFSILHVIFIFMLSLLTATFRLESGIFLFIMIPVYLIFNLKVSNRKKYLIVIPITIAVIFGLFAALYFHNAYEVYEKSTQVYVESDKGGGFVGMLSQIPIVGRFFAIIYNAVLPIPFWSRFGYGGNVDRIEVYNIMNFPHSFSSFFNWFALVIISTFALSKSIRKRVKKKINKKLVVHLLIGLFFLYIQATVIAKRRIMMYYCIFYIFVFLINECLTIREKRINLILAIIGFILLQFVGIFYLS